MLAPEVVQTSTMDCAPAALKCLLAGWGIQVSYDQLREACQTDVDGTSIDAVADNARRFGLIVDQELLPDDHIFEPAADALPAVALLRQPQGTLHAVVLWRQHGHLVQVMDPARGRRWMSKRALISDLHVYVRAVPAEAFEAWVRSDTFLAIQRSRLRRLGASAADCDALIAAGLTTPGWLGIAALDAAVRLALVLLRAGGVSRGKVAVALVATLAERARGAAAPTDVIPWNYWAGVAAPPGESGAPQIAVRASALLVARGRDPEAGRVEAADERAAAAPRRPLGELLRLLAAESRWNTRGLTLAVAVAAAGAVVEALVLRGLLDVGRDLRLWHQRIGAISAVLVLLLALTLLQIPVATLAAGIGRRLEARLRVSILSKIPRLGDHYFRSRPVSDLAERCHEVHRIRQLPQLAQQLLQSGLALLVTLAGVLWLAPEGWLAAVAAGVAAVAVPLALGPVLSERDLRVRTHGGALIRYYLDALLGLVAVRAHGAERAVRREHEALLAEWARASRVLARASLLIEGVQALVGYGLAAWLVLDHHRRSPGAPGTLLLAYWALSLPQLGQELVAVVRQYPGVRNTALRLLEPLTAPDEQTRFQAAAAAEAIAAGPVRLELRGVVVAPSRHAILSGVDLVVEPGEHVGIVGPSGAGKSTLVGLLLGWHRAAAGEVLVDGRPLDGPALTAVRRATAWVAPELALWNRSLHHNLVYGAHGEPALSLPQVFDAADLRRLVAQLPDGWQTRLGEGGALVSGGEGQRIRFARALLRAQPRLVILDEAFHGLDREQRSRLLAVARDVWRDATLLCITHDVADTLTMPRVLVVDDGRVVEDDAPEPLAARPSRYRALLEAERAVRTELGDTRVWRTFHVDGTAEDPR